MRKGQRRRAVARGAIAITAAVVAAVTAVVVWGGSGVAMLADVVWM